MEGGQLCAAHGRSAAPLLTEAALRPTGAQGGISTLINPPFISARTGTEHLLSPATGASLLDGPVRPGSGLGLSDGATGGRPRLSHRQGLPCTPHAGRRLPRAPRTPSQESG